MGSDFAARAKAAADKADSLLDQPNWRPTRRHYEALRNVLRMIGNSGRGDSVDGG
jgi:hypothetical protein